VRDSGRRYRAARRDGAGEDRSEVRAAVARFLVMGFAALLLVTTPVAFWILEQAERHALNNARNATQRLADFAIGPLVTEQLFAGDPAAIQGLDNRIAPWLDRGNVLRIKVWDSTGRVVYSDVNALIGNEYALPDWGEALLAGGEGTATVENQDELENEFESTAGELVEVYVRSMAATGEPLIFEAYYDDDDVRAEQAAVLRDVAPAILLALAVLQLAQLIPAVRLARRIQADQAVRRRLLQRSLEASDLERRRIARDLHDEVIQDLAGLSYAMEAEEMRSSPGQRALLTQAHLILQDNVKTLRAMTAELYPINLEKLGLPAAMNRLADPLRQAGIHVTLRGENAEDLSRESSAMFYRVAREALANVLKHAGADSVELSLENVNDATVLQIRDDGRGFDPGHGAPEAHLGMQIMKDTIEDAGGSLAVVSAPGEGTVVEARLASGDAHFKGRVSPRT
jgi:two-component system NarL family sensor kinase